MKIIRRICNVFFLISVSIGAQQDRAHQDGGYRDGARPNQGKTVPLFELYPALQQKIPYVSFSVMPSPVEKMQKIGEMCGAEVYIKRDDKLGGIGTDGMPLYGGNKVRKLEFLLGDAQSLGAKRVITFGCVGSHHAVATTVYANLLGMDTTCMLLPQPVSPGVQKNLLMHLYYKSTLYLCETDEQRTQKAFAVWLELYKQDKQPPYVIPTGGSNILGTIGFVNAIFELRQQIKQGLIPEPSHIYAACGSGATIAGIMLGVKAAGLRCQVIAVAVEPDQNRSLEKKIALLFHQTNTYLRGMDSAFPECSYTAEDLKINTQFTGTEYGSPTAESIEAQEIMRTYENIELDSTYTAKAFAGLLNDIIKEPRQVVLFWNTYSSTDVSLQIKDQDYHQLPECFHHYFSKK